MDSGTKQFLRVDKYDIESTNDLNSSDIIDGDKSPRLQNLLEEDSIKVSEENTKK